MEEKQKRRAGILMPISALPSSYGIGDLGAGAYAFLDWLEKSGMKIWQVLPLLPTGFGDSPYQSFASNALNYYFIDFESLEKDGLLEKSDYADIVFSTDETRVDYGRQFQHKIPILRKAFARFNKADEKWQSFLKNATFFDFALFMSLKVRFHYASWDCWPLPFQNADSEEVKEHVNTYQAEIEFWQFTQYIFLNQWKQLLSYAHKKGIKIMGDMPIYVAYDSVETWKYRERLFMTDEKGSVSLRAGVPPDAFSEDGQFWGNPVYDWAKNKAENYAWWNKRFQDAFTLFDIVRIDHFRAFDRFYAIPCGAKTAKEGEWMDGPKASVFAGAKNKEIIAEDLGVRDDGVRALLRETGYPGMKVFVFAFDGNPDNEYLPDKYPKNCVVYTGTHDNAPLSAFIESLSKDERKSFEIELEKQCLKADVPYLTETLEDECESVIRLLFSTDADTVIVPMQDVLALGEESRFNAPSTVTDKNWTYRFTKKQLKNRKASWLKSMTEEYHR